MESADSDRACIQVFLCLIRMILKIVFPTASQCSMELTGDQIVNQEFGVQRYLPSASAKENRNVECVTRKKISEDVFGFLEM